jgi:hypothetical protein
MRHALIALIVGTALCREAVASTPVTPACTYKVQAFVAHQDDDLFFMQTDLQRDIARGACVQVVYLTNGKIASDTWEYSAKRDLGAMTAWSSMLGAPAPDAVPLTRDRLDLLSRKPVRYTDPSGRVTHIHLGIDDPWEGAGWGSHTPLSHMVADLQYAAPAYPDGPPPADAAGSSAERYTSGGLARMIANLAFDYDPDLIYLQDPSITTPVDRLCRACGENHDHPDHPSGAKMAIRGSEILESRRTVQFYTGDPDAARPANLTPAESDAKTRVAAWYGTYDSKYTCARASAAASPTCVWPADAQAKWLQSQYVLVRNGDQARSQIAPVGTPEGKGGPIIAYVGNKDNKLHVRDTASRRRVPVEGRFASVPAVLVGQDARVSVFARTAQHDLVHLATNAAGEWLPAITWQDSVIVSSPRAIANHDGRSAVVARAVDSSVLYRAETSVGGAWGPWQPTGLKGVGDVVVVKDASGALAVAVREEPSYGPVVIQSQVLPGQSTFRKVNFPWAATYMDPIMLNGANGSVIVITKETDGRFGGRGVGDFTVYRQSSPGALSESTTWVKSGLGVKENWVNATAAIRNDKVIMAGNCGADKYFYAHGNARVAYPNLCVWKDGVSTDLGPVDGAPQFVSGDGAEPMLVVRSENGESVLASRFKDGVWSALSAL